jgi:H+/gluconate symporter-like permease
MPNNVIIIGLILNLIASLLIAYGRIFRSRKTIKKESNTEGGHNPEEEKHRIKETRIAQIGAGLMVVDLLFKLLAMSLNSDFNQFHRKAHFEDVVNSMSIWAAK